MNDSFFDAEIEKAVTDELKRQRAEREQSEQNHAEKQKGFTLTCGNCGANVDLMQTVLAGAWRRSIDPIKIEVEADNSVDRINCSCGNTLGIR